eukprot:3104358-Pleurochrysis_carterae.AAC.3
MTFSQQLRGGGLAADSRQGDAALRPSAMRSKALYVAMVGEDRVRGASLRDDDGCGNGIWLHGQVREHDTESTHFRTAQLAFLHWQSIHAV